MNVYRINLRFDLDDERERMAAEYLQQFRSGARPPETVLPWMRCAPISPV